MIDDCDHWSAFGTPLIDDCDRWSMQVAVDWCKWPLIDVYYRWSIILTDICPLRHSIDRYEQYFWWHINHESRLQTGFDNCTMVTRDYLYYIYVVLFILRIRSMNNLWYNTATHMHMGSSLLASNIKRSRVCTCSYDLMPFCHQVKAVYWCSNIGGCGGGQLYSSLQYSAWSYKKIITKHVITCRLGKTFLNWIGTEKPITDQ